MKTKFLNTIGILAIALSAGTASAQTLPNSFNYQAVITAEDGSVLTMKGGEIFALRISVDIPTEFHLSRTEMVQGS